MTAGRLAGYRAPGGGGRPRSGTWRRWPRRGGRFVCPGDREWPSQLDDLGDARPVGLWVRGRPDLRLWALRSVAVVGARACTPYGAHMAATLGAGLAERGWVVVSGAAYGVDGAAHRGAWPRAARPSACWPAGSTSPYPRGHAELIGRIAEQGLVVGELPPGDHPTRSRFVLRNRVIAALTRGTVVVEAEYRSGSLVTARQAQRLGPVHDGGAGPRHQRPLGRGARTAARRRPCWSPTPPKSSSWSGTSATSRPTGAARCCPGTCWTRWRARVLDALPAPRPGQPP